MTELRVPADEFRVGDVVHVGQRSVLVRHIGRGSGGQLTVNEIRAEHGLPPVPLEEILRVEQQAGGHSDYSLKFAFYCAELAQK
ncbi:hypothetical protein [Streptomyces sp. NPDC059631]|uniref:hypothetical protein n=1 Tax=unclassified Streptomyces TaxID=2593676 RepID=UPI0036CD877C